MLEIILKLLYNAVVRRCDGMVDVLDSKEANQDAKMDRIFQMLHKFKIRVLPPQPDRVVVTDFVATTFCFLNQVFRVYAIPCRTDGESFGITGGCIIVCNFGFVMIVYA